MSETTYFKDLQFGDKFWVIQNHRLNKEIMFQKLRDVNALPFTGTERINTVNLRDNLVVFTRGDIPVQRVSDKKIQEIPFVNLAVGDKFRVMACRYVRVQDVVTKGGGQVNACNVDTGSQVYFAPDFSVWLEIDGSRIPPPQPHLSILTKKGTEPYITPRPVSQEEIKKFVDFSRQYFPEWEITPFFPETPKS